MSIFPFISFDEEEIIKTNELPLLKEIAIDFKSGVPILGNKSFKVVEGKEALKVWIFKALKIDRFQYEIYSWDFGSEIMDLMGKGYTKELTKSEVERYIKEALEINPYISRIDILDVDFLDNVLKVNLKIASIYGDIDIEI